MILLTTNVMNFFREKHHEVLKKAKCVVYSKHEIKGIPYNWLKKYFKLGTGTNKGKFKVKEPLKSVIYFKRINLNDDHYPIDEPLHMIFCRNVFIYFDNETQTKILDKFYRYLQPGGILF